MAAVGSCVFNLNGVKSVPLWGGVQSVPLCPGARRERRPGQAWLNVTTRMCAPLEGAGGSRGASLSVCPRHLPVAELEAASGLPLAVEVRVRVAPVGIMMPSASAEGPGSRVPVGNLKKLQLESLEA